jgi:CRP/FNR family transcriptional regulator
VPQRRISKEDFDFMSLLSAPNRRRLLENSTRAVYPAGAVVFHPDGPDLAFLIDRGLVRAYWIVRDGRQATVAFIHSKQLVGATTLLRKHAWYYGQLVTESTLTSIDLRTARALLKTENEVTRAVALQLAERMATAARLVTVRTLGNLRERLAFDLLERACQTQLILGKLEAQATQGDLADSIGSSREVVSRALSSLRAQGIVETAPGVVKVLDATRLCAIVQDFEV